MITNIVIAFWGICAIISMAAVIIDLLLKKCGLGRSLANHGPTMSLYLLLAATFAHVLSVVTILAWATLHVGATLLIWKLRDDDRRCAGVAGGHARL